ncbi:MAG: DNA-binding transcriptional LysR family regulator [Myxococcota bacterium]|jgi:DNA-binding transcriptional LysR family regulator
MRFCMNWNAMNFDWNRARAFLVTADEGSFSAAARALGSTQPTVGRQVAALETALGVTLFERIGTRLELTGTGLDLVEHVRAMGEAAIRFSLAATGQSESIAGTVCITASESVAAFLLPPILGALRLEHPGIELELVVSNDARDLQQREADIAIRNFRSEQPDLIARKVREITAHFYAAPSYIERVGPLDSAEDMGRAELFAFDRSDTMIDGLKAMGLDVRREQFTIVTGNHLVQWAMCKQGAGVCMMMDDVGAREPGVVKVFTALPSIRLPIWLVCHRELHTSRRMRLVFDWLAEGLAG